MANLFLSNLNNIAISCNRDDDEGGGGSGFQRSNILLRVSRKLIFIRTPKLFFYILMYRFALRFKVLKLLHVCGQ